MQPAQVLWVTGVPLAPAEPGTPDEASTRPDLVNRALLVLLEVSAASDATDTARVDFAPPQADTSISAIAPSDSTSSGSTIARLAA